MKRRLIYVSKFPESVFDGQVLDLLGGLRAYEGPDAFHEIVLLAGVAGGAGRARLRALSGSCAALGLALETFRLHPLYPGWTGRTLASLRRALERVDPDREGTVLHVRGELLAYLMERAGCCLPHRTLVDVRGAAVAEASAYHRRWRPLRWLKLRVKREAVRSLSRYPWVSFVSDALRTHIRNAVPRPEGPGRDAVIPGLAGRAFRFDAGGRSRVRGELGVGPDEPLAVVSVGGSSGWQQTEEVVRGIAQRGIRVLNLSRTEVEGPGVINRFVPYGEMPAYLSAADVGVLWRPDDLVNHVAAPVKFAEYVCTGLPVITNGTVRGARAFLERERCGLVVPSFREVTPERVRELVASVDRHALAARAAEVYGHEAVVSAYRKLYRGIMELEPASGRAH